MTKTVVRSCSGKRGVPKCRKIHRKTPVPKILTNMINQYFISTTFRTCFFSLFSTFNNEKKVSYKRYNMQITTHENDKVQSHDQEESKLTSTIDENSPSGHLPAQS